MVQKASAERQPLAAIIPWFPLSLSRLGGSTNLLVSLPSLDLAGFATVVRVEASGALESILDRTNISTFGAHSDRITMVRIEEIHFEFHSMEFTGFLSTNGTRQKVLNFGWRCFPVGHWHTQNASRSSKTCFTLHLGTRKHLPVVGDSDGMSEIIRKLVVALGKLNGFARKQFGAFE